MSMHRAAVAVALVAATWAWPGAEPRRAQARPEAAVMQAPGSAERAGRAGQRRALYGDLHLHTAFSFDSYAMMGNTDVTPDVAYRFARGEPIVVFGRTIRRRWPLDFLAITDHPENLGSARTARDPASPFSRTALGRRVARIGDDPKAALIAALENLRGEVDRETFLSAWQEEVDAANRHYAPGTFTTFIGYEWASQVVTGTYETTRAIHRNVIFSGATAPLPFTTFQSKDPEDLWGYLERTRARHGDVLAITNHPTASQGLVYAWEDSRGKAIDRTYARRRALNEPLSEIANPGGDHESVREVSPDDRWLPSPRRWTRPDAIWLGGTIRDAWGRGLVAHRRIGANPFAFGIVGSTDSHTGLSISLMSSIDGAPNTGAPNTANASSSADAKVWPATYDQVPGPLTGVWAEDNTREAIFSAFRRKEVFATSGPRMKLRLFGGWTYRPSLFGDTDWPTGAYAEGVAMGSDLPARPAGAHTPRFLIWAEKSPEGRALEHAQMIKLSLVGDRYVEMIFDLTGNGRPATHDAGHRLSLFWEDPQFDPAVPAVYYIRVLEEPTPLHATVFDRHPRYGLPADWPRTTQERGWSSPIWYWPANRQ